MDNQINTIPARILEEKKYCGRPITPGMLRGSLEKSKKKIVVLDDDPTGIQTVHDVSVFTDWKEENVLEGFRQNRPVFFILTNSRAFDQDTTAAVHKEIAAAVARAARKTEKDYVIVSRSDSTLRGHYWTEMNTLRSELELHGQYKFDGEILCPFFLEGGRYTMDDIHYVQDKDVLVPCGETEYARDETFHFKNSNLRDYIIEKSGGQWADEDTISISLEELRRGDTEEVYQKLTTQDGYKRFIVNATSMEQLNVFSSALIDALSAGKHFLIRSAASLVKSLGGFGEKPYLTREDLVHTFSGTQRLGGLIVVGSHTDRTNQQLEEIKSIPNIKFLEFDARTVFLPDDQIADTVSRLAARAESYIRAGQTTVVFTSRQSVSKGEIRGEEALNISVRISEALQNMVRLLETAPSYLIAKGGITSSDIGVKALGVHKAEAAGQVLPGVPVWKTDRHSLFPGLAYIIFPGNVGNRDSLKDLVERLEQPCAG